MNRLVDILNAAAEAWLSRAGVVAWQWPLLVVAVAAPLAFLLRAHAPALRYWVWQLALLKLLLMPIWVWTLSIPWLPAVMPSATVPDLPVESRVPVIASSSPVSAAMPERTTAPVAQPSSGWLAAPERPRPPIRWPAWMFAAWLSVVVLQVGRLFSQRRRLALLLTGSRPADAPLVALVRSVVQTLGLGAVPRTRLVEREGTPFVCGIWQPTLVIPAGLCEALAESQLRQVLLHELAHIRRRDLAWGWVPELARIVWWFHPVMHWVVFRLRLERELACDQLALAHSNQNAADYAETLVQIVSRSSASVQVNSRRHRSSAQRSSSSRG